MPRTFRIPALFITALALTMLLSTLDYSWSGWRPSLCWPDNCFCEAVHSGLIRQPANTWSSFAFLWVGLLVIFPSSSLPGSNPLNREKMYRRIYGVALILIGLGSAFLHASLTFVGQFFDVSGMNLLASFVLLYNLHRARPYSPRIFLIAYLVINAILAWLLIEYSVLRRWLFAAVLLAGLVPVLWQPVEKPRMEKRWLLYALLAQFIAFVTWTLDLRKILCAPESLFQGHAVWHLLGALAAFFLYQFYLTESVAEAAR